VAPASDCDVVGDCSAAYFPKLSVASDLVTFTYQPGQRIPDAGILAVSNAGGGTLHWSASIAFTTGSGWLELSNATGQSGANLFVIPKPERLAAGTYKANVVVDAGPYAGHASIPVTLTVQPAASGGGASVPVPPPPAEPEPAQPAVVVTRVVNAATFESTPLVAGSLGTLFGSRLVGKEVSVTVDSLRATLRYAAEGQINFQVPEALVSRTSATVLVTVDGISSTPVTVTLAPAAPAVFARGVLNQDNTVNAPETAAAAGTVLQIFGMGIPTGATMSVEIGGRKELQPLYAGIAPDVPGAQQINVAVPGGLAAGAVPLVICAGFGGQQYCTPGYALFVK
jgi:uncharacterized protein (TIGR03437 family)